MSEVASERPGFRPSARLMLTTVVWPHLAAHQLLREGGAFDAGDPANVRGADRRRDTVEPVLERLGG